MFKGNSEKVVNTVVSHCCIELVVFGWVIEKSEC